jgi:enhancing lycopene biosynthesis protein 2
LAKKVAIILSGCGFLDGSEVYESVLTFLALDKAGVAYQCFAPDIPQYRVMNYITGQEVPNEKRNVLIESARLARGEIKPISQACASDFSAAIFPGGFGAALNLSDFALKGAECSINPDVEQFAKAMFAQHKPLGFICIAPALIPKICGKGVKCTIGNDVNTASQLTAMGAIHQNCTVGEIVVDEQHKVVTTPAYMLGQSIAEVAQGIEKLVAKVVALYS